MRMVRARFGEDVAVMAEPGRGLVAEAGVIVAEVVLVARKDQDDLARWVYLDIGKFLRARRDHGRGRPATSSRPATATPPPGLASSRGRRATWPTCSTRSARCSCRSGSRPATRCGSSAPAPTPRATRRSASTASRRSKRSSSADAGRTAGDRGTFGAEPGGPDADRADHRPAHDRLDTGAGRLRRRRGARLRCSTGVERLRPDAVLLTGDLAENGLPEEYRGSPSVVSGLVRADRGRCRGTTTTGRAFAEGLAVQRHRHGTGAGAAPRARGRAGAAHRARHPHGRGTDVWDCSARPSSPGSPSGSAATTRGRSFSSCIIRHSRSGCRSTGRGAVDGDELARIVLGHPRVLAAACGHVHRTARVNWAGTVGSVCPACRLGYPLTRCLAGAVPLPRAAEPGVPAACLRPRCSASSATPKYVTAGSAFPGAARLAKAHGDRTGVGRWHEDAGKARRSSPPTTSTSASGSTGGSIPAASPG